MAAIVTPNGGTIVVNDGTWVDRSETDMVDLAQNQLIEPAYRTILAYSQKRMLMTLITSGAVGQFGVKNIPSKVKDLEQKAGKTIGSKGYQFAVQGRIQRSIEINSQIGASRPDGSFTLSLKDRLYEGMNCNFNGQAFSARVMTNPQGSPNNWIMDFQSDDGTVFVWATHVAQQGPVKTLFGGHTSYAAGSTRGYSDDNFPDMYINHTTTARMTDAIDSDTDSQIRRITYTAPESEGGSVADRTAKGYINLRIARNNSVFLMQHEDAAWNGVSTMKGPNNTVLNVSRQIDRYTGKPVIAGDGIIPQIDGGSRAYGSGVNGLPMANDFIDMVFKIRRRSNAYIDTEFICVTDLEGMKNFQFNICPGMAATQNITMFQNVNADGKEATTGVNFMRINVGGTWVTIIEHPMFSDLERFTVNQSTGFSQWNCTYVFLNVADANIEQLDKGGNGYDRSAVEGWYHGLTGKPGASGIAVTEEDATKFARLVEKVTMVYQTQSCGILSR